MGPLIAVCVGMPTRLAWPSRSASVGPLGRGVVSPESTSHPGLRPCLLDSLSLGQLPELPQGGTPWRRCLGRVRFGRMGRSPLGRCGGHCRCAGYGDRRGERVPSGRRFERRGLAWLQAAAGLRSGAGWAVQSEVELF